MSSKLQYVVTIFRYSKLFLPYGNQFIVKTSNANVFTKTGLFARIFSTEAHKNSIFSLRKHEKVKIDIPKYGQLLDSWYYNVKPFGKIQIRSPMAVYIQPLDPQKYPDMDKVFVNIMYTGDPISTEQGLAVAKKQYIVGINLDDTNEEIEVDLRYKTRSSLPAVCDVQIPIKFDVQVLCSDEGAVTLKKLESSSVHVVTDKGNCTCKNIKSGTVDILSRNGNIISETVLQGNLSLRTNNGDIVAGKLQGQVVTCHSEGGNINIKSVYADNSEFMSMYGSISLTSCHGNSSVDIKNGDLSVDTLDGSLKAMVDSGSTSVYLAREGYLNLNSNSGDIEVKVPHSFNSSVHLEGRSVEEGEVTIQDKTTTQSHDRLTVTGDVGEKSAGAGKIVAQTKTGTIQLQYQDWFSALNLGKDP